MGVVEILEPTGIVSSEWEGSPNIFAPVQHLNVDELMLSIDTADWNRQLASNKTIKHFTKKLTNTGTVNSIKMAMAVERYATQGIAGLRLNVYLNGSRIVPQTDISVDTFSVFKSIQCVWPANVFLAPWVGLTGLQVNDEIDLDTESLQYWCETISLGGPIPTPDNYET